MARLGVNIDHVATVREARRGLEPDPVEAAQACERAGCDSIVCHLREDRRHIKDADLSRLKAAVRRLNLEMSVAGEIVEIACAARPWQATLVPEKRQEVTTEGGLDVAMDRGKVTRAVSALSKAGINVSLFIDPRRGQIDAALRTGATIIELHTGEYANAKSAAAARRRLLDLDAATRYAIERGMTVNAGHGLTYGNAAAVAAIEGMNELNIGHSIVSRAIFVGLESAVRDMVKLIR